MAYDSCTLSNPTMKFRKNTGDVSNAQNKIQLFPILLINFIGTLGFSIVLPFLVFLVKDFGGNAIVFGILSATYPTFQLIGAPILGRWSDTYGRKKILLLSNAGTLIGWIFFLVALFLPNIVGPALAAILGSTIFGNILPVLAALILSLVTLIVITVTLKEFRSPSGVVLVPEKGTIRKVFAQECKECYEVEDPNRKLRFKDEETTSNSKLGTLRDQDNLR